MPDTASRRLLAGVRGLIELDIADLISGPLKSEFRNSTIVGPESVVRATRFTCPEAAGAREGYRIVISDPQFRGRLHFLLGPGGGDVVIEGRGPINVSFRLWRKIGIRIGEATTITEARIVCDNADIHVGRNGLWSDEIIVQSNDQHGIIDLETMKPVNGGRRHITIAEHVWIGRRSMIMPDVTIARESIVAAGACVTSDVESNSIYAGIPARKIRSGITWSRSPTGLSDFERHLLGYDKGI